MYGNKNFKKKVEQEVEDCPLTLGDIILQKKSQQKYLGDMLDERGLAASVETTVKSREGKTKRGIYELRSVCYDFRAQILGGMTGALALWETCISLFYFFQNTSKLAHLLTQAVYTPKQSGVKISEFFSGKSRLATLF